MAITTDTRDSETTPPMDPAGNAPDGEQPGGGRGWILAVVVLVLLVYPAARWLMGRGASAPAAPAQTANVGVALQTSFQHYQAGRYQEAIASAKQVLAADPNSVEAYNNIAVSYMGLHNIDEAIKAAQEALRLKPDYQLAKNNLAWFQREKINASRPALSPEATAKVASLLNQSLASTQARRYAECIEGATAATRLDPFSAAAFNNLGFCQGALGQWDDAIKNLQQAVQIDGTLQLAKNNLAWAAGEKAKAGKAR